MGIDRGNDGDNARRELSSQYAGFESAEDLIRHQDSQFDGEMDKALNKPVDVNATKALDLGKIDPANEGGVVLDAAVRGGRLIVVEEHEGRLKKWSVPHAVNRGSASIAAAAAGGQAPPSDEGAQQGTQQNPEAPSNVTVPTIKAKLDELGISEGDATRKDDLWALVPAEAREALLADTSS